MNNILEYAKKAREAYINYISGPFNPDVCDKISSYINRLENLNEKEEEELTNFINENTAIIEHIADIQIPEDNNRSVKAKFKRIIPMRLSKTSGRIYKANGNFKSLVEQNNIVKIRKLTKFKPKKNKINQ